jgi:hypothetical protein
MKLVQTGAASVESNRSEYVCRRLGSLRYRSVSARELEHVCSFRLRKLIAQDTDGLRCPSCLRIGRRREM